MCICTLELSESYFLSRVTSVETSKLSSRLLQEFGRIIFSLFVSLFFRSPFYYFFVNKKNLVVDLNRQTMPVRSAG